MNKAQQMRENYKKKTGKDWPFLIGPEDVVKVGQNPEYGKFLLNTVGPVLHKVAKGKGK